MADDKGQEVLQVSEEVAGPAPAAKQGFVARVVAHYKKWWWVHLIILVVVVLVVTLPVVYVGYPRIAQNDVNKSTLNVTNMVFSDPTPNSIHVNQTQVLGSKSSYHPTIYGFNSTISLIGASAPLSTALIPRSKATNGEVINVDSTLALSETSGAVNNFTLAVLGLETFEMNIYGVPDLKLGALPKDKVTFNKTVTMNGLNSLKGFALENIMITSDLAGMNGTASIPNPSVITIAMGNVTFDVSIGGTPIGQSHIENFVLVPGQNRVPLQGSMNTSQVLELITAKNSPYADGVLPLDIRGNSSVYNGVEIPYYSEALQANTLHATMNITQVIIDSGLGKLLSGLM